MESFLSASKEMITRNNLEGLKEFYKSHADESYAWEYIYQKLYLHACLKKRHDIVSWMKPMFVQFDPIQQIGLRQMFSYGNYLLAK